jgi:hypothetical protein
MDGNKARAAQSPPWEYQSEEAELRAMGPDGWHRLALHGNWDTIQPQVWRWIVTQPDCDRATALLLFWKTEPEFYLEFADRANVPDANRFDFDLIELIRDRWFAGAYTRAELALDLDEDAWPLDFADLRQRYGDRVDRFMPPSMRVRLPGRRIAEGGEPLPGESERAVP